MPAFDLSRWREISPYLDHALDCACEARGAWLDRLRTENPAIARDIEALLAEQQALDRAGFLVTDPISPALAMPAAAHAIAAYVMGTLARIFCVPVSCLAERFRSVW
jgi:hypothetical protein